ncbi:hypothetical protein ASE23_01350 [Rhizobium sp. Root73]|nr:hypothetical protein ASC96_04450 [Rhizobium sp. Root1204]KQY17335.1 hypothetical protein ASD36_01350 [Rhizobium sp. Root1334]KRC13220.1 hypothetical protein ASE23_01350 [Rhizobium sp. Root73]
MGRAGPQSGQGEISTVVHPSQPFLETSMAEIIRLEDRLVRAPPKPSMGPIVPSKALILLFTGIRYERLDGHPDNTPAKPAPSRAKKH